MVADRDTAAANRLCTYRVRGVKLLLLLLWNTPHKVQSWNKLSYAVAIVLNIESIGEEPCTTSESMLDRINDCNTPAHSWSSEE